MDGWQTQVITSSDAKASTAVKLTVLLPAYNEEQAIGRVLEEIVEALTRDDAPSFEILLSTMPRPIARPSWPRSSPARVGNARCA